MTQKLIKRAGEVRTYIFDFEQFPEIILLDTLTGVPVVTATNQSQSGLGTPPTIGTPSIAAGAKKVNCVLSGGSDNALWLMECQCATVGGSTLVCTGLLQITEN